jgi:hypothetical protein
VTLQKYFSAPSLFIYFFQPHPYNREQQLDHIYYTLLWQVLGFAVPFTSLSKLCKNAGPKPFC